VRLASAKVPLARYVAGEQGGVRSSPNEMATHWFRDRTVTPRCDAAKAAHNPEAAPGANTAGAARAKLWGRGECTHSVFWQP